MNSQKGYSEKIQREEEKQAKIVFRALIKVVMYVEEISEVKISRDCNPQLPFLIPQAYEQYISCLSQIAYSR